MAGKLFLLNRSLNPHAPNLELTDGEFLVGRSSECHFLIPDISVSRRHAQITIAKGVVTVRDLDSANGTRLNGKAIRAAQVVAGQRLQFGQVGFLVSARKTVEIGPDSTEDTARHVELDGQAKTRPEVIRSRLSPAQTRVLDRLLEGLSEKAIAKALRISKHTVHTHVHDIYRICRVHSRPELLALFVVRGDERDFGG